MVKKSPVAIFMAASAILAANVFHSTPVNACEEDMGGLKEWNSDQDIDAKSKLDKDARRQAEKAKKEDICIPIGEGENCW